jgi:enamine deaminase RidA (YjgF/YER057c/UK114 family)
VTEGLPPPHGIPGSAAGSVARERLASAGLKIPAPPQPGANYLPWRLHGSTLYLAGVASETGGGPVVEVPVAREVAAGCALRQLAAVEAALGSLDLVEFVLRLTGYVACAPGWGGAPEVIDAASEVFITAFGDAGRHARSAIGVSGLPTGATVEIEAILAVRSVIR